MEPKFTFTRGELIDAFTRWHAACGTDSNGNLKGKTPDKPVAQADLLIGYLTGRAV